MVLSMMSHINIRVSCVASSENSTNSSTSSSESSSVIPGRCCRSTRPAYDVLVHTVNILYQYSYTTPTSIIPGIIYTYVQKPVSLPKPNVPGTRKVCKYMYECLQSTERVQVPGYLRYRPTLSGNVRNVLVSAFLCKRALHFCT